MFSDKRKRVTITTGSETLVKQSHKDECDINNILAQYKRTGIVTHVRNSGITYEYLPDQMDFQEAMGVVRQAEEAFQALPAAVRERFGNDPAALLAAVHDPDAAEELRKLGILKPLPPVDIPGKPDVDIPGKSKDDAKPA